MRRPEAALLHLRLQRRADPVELGLADLVRRSSRSARSPRGRTRASTRAAPRTPASVEKSQATAGSFRLEIHDQKSVQYSIADRSVTKYRGELAPGHNRTLDEVTYELAARDVGHEPGPGRAFRRLVTGTIADPRPFYAELRAQAPVYRTPFDFWYVSRYDLAVAISRDDEGWTVSKPPTGGASSRGIRVRRHGTDDADARRG